MKRPLFLLLSFVFLNFHADAQKRNFKPRPKPAALKSAAGFEKAIVIDERLAVLRAAPSLFAKPVQRMRRGRTVTIFESRESDGVTFYRVAVAAAKTQGWVQREAVAGRSRRGDDERLARLVQASDGFDQIERAQLFLENFPDSPFRPSILLLFGDLMEEIALKMSADAARRLSRREMAATGAPLYSFYLNYASLDRYQRLGIGFVFNTSTRLFHYDGASWREIVKKSPAASEAVEARRRLDSLKEKMAAGK